MTGLSDAPGAAQDACNVSGSPIVVSFGRGLLKETAMTMYTVGLKLRARTKAVTIEAEDALVAALKIKLDNPEAFITYVRKANRRGDRRHPHEAITK
jgi:hypothetical protein